MALPVLVTDDIEDKEIIFSIYKARKISGILYIDDGKSLNYKNGNYSLILCEGSSSPGFIKIKCSRIEGNLNPLLNKHPSITFIIHFDKQIDKIENVAINDIPINNSKIDNKPGWVFKNNSLRINYLNSKKP